jgi:uncharacterized protein YbjT (DUF2867 family)
MTANDAGRTAVLAGATGLVGRELLAQLLADDRYTQVTTVGRRPVAGLASPKLRHLPIDLAAPQGLPPCDDVFVALGTTIKIAGSQPAFAAVDLHGVVNVARAALANPHTGTQRIAVVSALGADPRSRVFYSRTKGEMEVAVAALGYRRVVFARPSFLGGDRAALGGAHRPGEGLGIRLTNALGPLVPKKYRVVSAAAVARGLIAALWASPQGGVQILESDELQAFA